MTTCLSPVGQPANQKHRLIAQIIMCIEGLKESMLRGGQSNSHKVDNCFTAVRHIFQILSLF